MDTIEGFRAVIAVAETGSFTAAALRLGISKSVVSKYVNAVENQHATKIFNRSTRKVSMTRAGRHFYHGIVHVLNEYTSLVDQVSEESTKCTGLLRITTSVTFGEQVLAPKLPKFMSLYPDIQLDLELNNRKVDLVEESFDLAIRVGSTEVQDFVATQICQFPMVLCATPEYIKQHGQPECVRDLNTHVWLIDKKMPINDWVDDKDIDQWDALFTSAPISVNSPNILKTLVKSGAGVALIPKFLVEEELADGTLIQLMKDAIKQPLSVHVIYPENKYIPEKSRVFINFLKQQYGDNPVEPQTQGNRLLNTLI
ncbi:LysR family transcriptional regulator [Pseudoalteromonas sp. R3]|uniref:LysR family transcriptional regulator n=1 Tax=Pseudoalteromonas sp. R3 TaxID=1709477 RepID=UPI0006B62609|nr:LysR family transcriptional regulator [Pseudoalteromonas sp. R3]